jgi:3-dehydroquinate synthase
VNNVKEIRINIGDRVSTVRTAESIRNIRDYAPPANTIIVTDENLYRHYSQMFSDYPVIVIGTGEGIKTLSTVETIVRKLIDLRAHRKTFLLGIGGGIVCDITGFAASIYMRGISFGFVSTSLLSQVDASVGGKNGVNIDGLKNMAGIISQPDFVICDHEMLKTLPDDEYVNGIAELVKTACLENKGLFQYISDNREKLLNRDSEIVSEAIYRSVKFKAKIVEEDEREESVRRILNLGHTLGHAVEKVKGTKHGLAVSAGIGFALELSKSYDMIDSSVENEVKDLLKYLGLPCELGEVTDVNDIPQLISAVESDKKKGGDTINFILLEGIGKSVIKSIKSEELMKYISNYSKKGN